MDNRMIHVSVSRLLDPDQTPATKVLWMVMRLNPSATPAQLEAQTGLSRHTVLSGIAKAKAWTCESAEPRARLPVALLADHTTGAQAKVLYGLLQTIPDFRGSTGKFTYASLAEQTGLARSTLRRAMAELVGAEWVQLIQASRVSPIKVTIGSPEYFRHQTEIARLRRRLKRGQSTGERGQSSGEAIMQEYLSLLVDSDQFTDNARPGFLINPLSGERLELDRFYPPASVAFEYHGDQHDRATAKFSQAQVDAQRLRDLIKAGICLYEGIQLIIVRAEDLSVQGMIRKIGHSLPLRSLAGRESLIDLLEEESLIYKASVDAARRAGNYPAVGYDRPIGFRERETHHADQPDELDAGRGISEAG